MHGELPATARSAVLKTAGTAGNRMGIDTSAPRHKTIKQHFDRLNQAWYCSLFTSFLKNYSPKHRVLTVLLLTSIVLNGKTTVSKIVVLSSSLSAGATRN